MNAPLSRGGRFAVLAAAFGGLLFDGFELGLMPLASLSVSKSLLGANYTATLGGDWFARFTAALMLGAAIGGIFLGALGDRIGRARAMGVSILFYSLFAGLGAWVQTQEQMLVLRFLVGLGVGGVWPNAVALVAESWPDKARPTVAGLMGAAINTGILVLSQVAQIWSVTVEAWRWLFHLAAAPAILGVVVIFFLPESRTWLAAVVPPDRFCPGVGCHALFRLAAALSARAVSDARARDWQRHFLQRRTLRHRGRRPRCGRRLFRPRRQLPRGGRGGGVHLRSRCICHLVRARDPQQSAT